MAAKKVTAEAILQNQTMSLDDMARSVRQAPPKQEQPKDKGGRPRKYQADEIMKRLSLSIPETTHAQLEQLAIEDSKPGARVSMTDIIKKLTAEETARREKAKARTAKN